MWFLKIYEKSIFIFFCKVQVTYKLKIDRINLFWEKILFCGFWACSVRKRRFLMYYQKSLHGMNSSDFFCVKLQWCKYLKNFSIIFWQNLSFHFSVPKQAQNCCKMRFFKFYEESTSAILSDFLNEVTAKF